MPEVARSQKRKRIMLGCLGLLLAAGALAYFFIFASADSDLETKGDNGFLGGIDINQMISLITSMIGLAIAVLNFRQARREKS